MKNKLFKGNKVPFSKEFELLEEANSSEDNVIEASWLKSALGEDPDLMMRHLRNQLAERFIITQLYPLYTDQIKFDDDLIASLFIKFKQENLIKDVDFAMSNVVGRLLERLDCYTIENLNPQLEVSFTLERDLAIFIALSDINLKGIDK